MSVCVCVNNACQSSSQEACFLKAGGKINRADVQTRLTECPSELNTTLMTHTHIHVCVCLRHLTSVSTTALITEGGSGGSTRQGHYSSHTPASGPTTA